MLNITEVGKVVAEALYGGERNLITINVSDSREAHTVHGVRIGGRTIDAILTHTKVRDVSPKLLTLIMEGRIIERAQVVASEGRFGDAFH